MNDLEFRLAEISLPRRASIADLLTLVSIRIDEEIEDIYIPPQKYPIVYVNPNFIERYCHTDEHLFMFIISEVYRLRLCQTSSFQGEEKEQEIAVRAVIHAFLCQVFPEEEYTSFFVQLYDAEIFPECLLRPPPNFPCIPQYPPTLHATIIELWNRLYYQTDVECDEIIESLRKIIYERRHRGKFHFPVLIGGRYCAHQIDLHKHRVFLLILSEFNFNNKFSNKRFSKNRSLLACESKYKIYLHPPRAPNKTLEKAIYAAARTGKNPHFTKRRSIQQNIQQAWPTRDRRAFASSAGGFQPLLYSAKATHTPYQLQRVDIYFDVSGSMMQYLKYCAEAIISCSKKLQPHIWLFSIGVHEISIEDFSSGEIPSNRGTSINEVAQHMYENKFQSVVIITDGWVGCIPAEYLEFCKKKVNIQVVYTPEHENLSLKSISNGEHIFESIDKK